jgi:hypothetical protein
LLKPKASFNGSFANYVPLVNDEYFMHDIYTSYLNEPLLNKLDENSFIFSSPKITRHQKATRDDIEILGLTKDDREQLVDNDDSLKYEFEISFVDYAYLTGNDTHIYAKKSMVNSQRILKFLLLDAQENDNDFKNDSQDVYIKELDRNIKLKYCYWNYHAKNIQWVPVKTFTDDNKPKTEYEKPSSNNIAELIKKDTELSALLRKTESISVLTKLGLGVSDIIRNTLENEEEKLKFDSLFTNIFISANVSNYTADQISDLLQDPKVKEDYEKRVKTRAQIKKNQDIGYTVESLFKEYIEDLKAAGKNISIRREPHGSDYAIYEDEIEDLLEGSEDNYIEKMFAVKNEKIEWLLELKSTKTKSVAMSDLQAETAKTNKENYALIVVEIDESQEIDIEYIKNNAMVFDDVGDKLDKLVDEYIGVQDLAADLEAESNGISVNFNDKSAKFRIKYNTWTNAASIEYFLKQHF